MTVSDLPPNHPADRWVIGIVILLATAFYAAILRYAINVPEVDDLMFVDSIRRIFADGTTLREVARLLVEQHNDHRILFSRLIVLADYVVEGQVNYRTLTLLGSLSVAGLLWQVYRLFRQANLALWTVLPVALLLFQPSYQEDVWWVLCLLSHVITLFLMIIVFRLLTQSGTAAKLLALALGGLVIFSLSNGLLMWVAVVALLGLTRQWLWAAVWLVTGVILISLYFGIDYNFAAKDSLVTVAQHPGWIMKSLVSFAGSAVYFDQRKWLLIPGQWLVFGVGIGVLVVIALSWVRLLLRFPRPIRPELIPFLGLGLMLAGTGMVAALARSDGNLMVVPRYQLYAVWCLIVVYVLLVMQMEGRQRQVVGWVGTLLAGWFWLNSWLYYGPQLAQRHSTQIAEGMALKQYQYSVLSQLFGRDSQWQKGWVQAMNQGIYQVPDLPAIRGIEAAMQAAPARDSTTRFTIDTRRLTHLNTDAIFIEQKTLSTPDFLYIRSAENWYLLPTQPLPKPIMKPWLANKGLKSRVLPIMLKPGTYQLGWVRQTEAGWLATQTRREVQILK